MEVKLRIMRIPANPAGESLPAVIVTTFLNGKIDEVQIFNQQGEEMLT